MMNTNTIKKTQTQTKINTKFLGFDDLLSLAESLSHSQGFYTRLYNNLQELDTDEQKQLDDTIKQQHFTTQLDLILWLEA